MRTWMTKSREIILPQASVSCSTTIYVAVSNIHNGPVFMIANSTNSRDFKRFLEEVKWSRTDEMSSDFYLILDGKC